MTSKLAIENDASWLPHRIDTARQEVEFLRISCDSLGQRGFLADHDPPPSERARLSWDEVKAMSPQAGNVQFIFHTAFCRSTLLVRAINAPGIAAGLSEPAIIPSLSQAGEAARDLIGPIVSLLSRPWQDGEAVIVKPTNHANMVLPALLRASPQSRAILMSNPMPSFLRSVARKGLMGRNWARKLFLELQSYAGMDFGMDPRESFAMTDMQTAGLAWFLNQRFFAMLVNGQVQGISGDRLAVLDGDRFDAERETTLASAFAHWQIDTPDDLPGKLAEGPVFFQHAKLGGTFSSATEQTDDAKLNEEIEQVAQWVGMIAEQAGVPVPLEHTLF